MERHLACVGVGVLLGWLGACGGGGGGGPVSTEHIVASEGGAVTSPDGSATLTIPPGALSDDTDVSIREVPESEWPQEVKDHPPLGGVWDLQPRGLTFNTPVQLVITLDQGGLVQPRISGEASYAAVAVNDMTDAMETLDTETEYPPDQADFLTTRAQINVTSLVWASDSGVGAATRPPNSYRVGAKFSNQVLAINRASINDLVQATTLITTASGAVRTEDGADETTFIKDLPWSSESEIASNGRLICAVAGRGTVLSTIEFQAQFDVHPPIDPQFPVSKFTVKVSHDVLCTGDAILLSDNTHVIRSGSTWSFAGATGVTANVIHASAELTTHFQDDAGVFGGVTQWQSDMGLSPITLSSSLQTGTATWNGAGYAISGLTGSPAFAASDTLVVSAMDGATPVEVSVPAPPPISDPNELFGTANGLRTEVGMTDGTFDGMFIFVAASGGTGDSGVIRELPASDMTLVGGRRVTPLLDDATIAALAAQGLTVTAVYVAYVNEQDTEVFFPGLRPSPVQAGRMFYVDLATLGP